MADLIVHCSSPLSADNAIWRRVRSHLCRIERMSLRSQLRRCVWLMAALEPEIWRFVAFRADGFWRLFFKLDGWRLLSLDGGQYWVHGDLIKSFEVCEMSNGQCFIISFFCLPLYMYEKEHAQLKEPSITSMCVELRVFFLPIELNSWNTSKRYPRAELAVW